MASWSSLRWHLAWAFLLGAAAAYVWSFMIVGLHLIGYLVALVGEWPAVGVSAGAAAVGCWGLSRAGTRAVPVVFPAIYACGLAVLVPAGEFVTVGVGLAALPVFAAVCLRPQVLLSPTGPAGDPVKPVLAVTPDGVSPTSGRWSAGGLPAADEASGGIPLGIDERGS